MKLACLVATMLVGASTTVLAQALDADGERFKTAVLKVYAVPDADRVRALLHPKSVACLRAETKYERYLMRAEAIQAVPADAKVSVEPVLGNAKLPYAGFDWPVRPSHVVRMEYGRTPTPGGGAITQIAEKFIVRDGGRWYAIMPCATPEGLRRLTEMGLLN